MDEIRYFFEDHWKKLLIGLGVLLVIGGIVLFTGGNDTEEPIGENGLILEDEDLSSEDSENEGESELDNESNDSGSDGNGIDSENPESDENTDDGDSDSGNDVGSEQVEDSVESGASDSSAELEIDEEFLSSLEGEDLDEINIDSEYRFSEESESVINKYLTEENNNTMDDFSSNVNINVDGVDSVDNGFVVLEQYLENPLRCGMDNYDYYMCIASVSDYVISTVDEDIDYSIFNEYINTGQEQIVRINGVLDVILEKAESEYSGNELQNIESVKTYYNTLNTILFLNGEITKDYINGDGDLSGEEYQTEIENLMTDYLELMGNDEHLVNSIKQSFSE